MLFDDVREGAPKLPTVLLGNEAGAKLARPPPARASSREASAPPRAAATTYAGEAASVDPLQMLMSQKRADNQQTTPQTPARPVTRAEHLEAFMAHQLPGVAPPTPPSGPARAAPAPSAGTWEAPAAAAPAPQATRRQLAAGGGIRATIQSRRDIDGVTWYSIRVWDGTGESFYQKRYSDFKEFDSRMRAQGSVAARALPDLPASGTLGLRHRLDVGDFNEKRQEGLQKWLDALLRNLNLTTVKDFFSRDRAPAPRTQPPEVASQNIQGEEDEGAIQWQ